MTKIRGKPKIFIGFIFKLIFLISIFTFLRPSVVEAAKIPNQTKLIMVSDKYKHLEGYNKNTPGFREDIEAENWKYITNDYIEKIYIPKTPQNEEHFEPWMIHSPGHYDPLARDKVSDDVEIYWSNEGDNGYRYKIMGEDGKEHIMKSCSIRKKEFIGGEDYVLPPNDKAIPYNKEIYHDFYIDEVEFEDVTKVPKFTVTGEAQPSGAGKVLINGIEGRLEGLEAGEKVTVAAFANPGWKFADQWTGTFENSERTFEFTMPESDVNLTAWFTKDTGGGSSDKYLNLTLNAKPSGSGTVFGKDNENKSGESITLTLPVNSDGKATFNDISAKRKGDYKFTSWVEVTGKVVGSFDYNSNSAQSITISEDTTLNACFNNYRNPPRVSIRNAEGGEDSVFATVMTNDPLRFGVVGRDDVDAQFNLTYKYSISDNLGHYEEYSSKTINSSVFGITGELSRTCTSNSKEEPRYANGLGGSLKFSKPGKYVITVKCTNTAGLSSMDSNTITVKELQQSKLTAKYKLIIPGESSTKEQQVSLDTSKFCSTGSVIQDDVIYIPINDGDTVKEYEPKFKGYWDLTDKNYIVKMVKYSVTANGNAPNNFIVKSKEDVPNSLKVKVKQSSDVVVTFYFIAEYIQTSDKVKVKYIVHDEDTGQIVGSVFHRELKRYGGLGDPVEFSLGENYYTEGHEIVEEINSLAAFSFPHDDQDTGYRVRKLTSENESFSVTGANSNGTVNRNTAFTMRVSKNNPNIIDIWVERMASRDVIQKFVRVDVDADEPKNGIDSLCKGLPTNIVSDKHIKIGNLVDMTLLDIEKYAPSEYLSNGRGKVIRNTRLTMDELVEQGMEDYKLNRVVAPYYCDPYHEIKYKNIFLSPYSENAKYYYCNLMNIDGENNHQNLFTDSAPDIIYAYYIRYRNSSTPKVYYSSDGGGIIKLRDLRTKVEVTNNSSSEKILEINAYSDIIVSAMPGKRFKYLKIWGGGFEEKTEETARIVKAESPEYVIAYIYPRSERELAKYSGAHYKAIFEDEKPTVPVDPPSTGGSGNIIFIPDSCTWTNEGKTSEGNGAYPVQVKYQGDNPVKGVGVVKIHHHEEIQNQPDKDGNLTPPTVIDYDREENFEILFELESITVSGDASGVISGSAGTVNITKEGKGLRLHAEGKWGRAKYVLPTPGENEVIGEFKIPDAPAVPTGDSGEYNLDWTRPGINVSPGPRGTWINNPVPYDVTITIEENLSGFKNSQVVVIDESHYGRNGSDNIQDGSMSYNKTIRLSDGIYTITVEANDIAGNENTQVVGKYYIDGTLPEASFSVSDTIFENGAIREGDKLYGTLTLSDNLSGVYRAEYSWTFGQFDYGTYTTLTVSGGQHYKCIGGAENMYKYTLYDRYMERPTFLIEKPVGDYLYLHVRVWDTAGNCTYKVFGPFEDPIKLKDFQVTDLRDPIWDSVFWNKDFTKPTGKVFPVSQLPLDGASHPYYKNAYIKKGYAFYFNLTSEYMYRDYDRIVITPTFYYWDSSGKLTPVDLYYNYDNNPLVKAGSILDKLGFNMNTKDGKVAIGSIPKLTLTKGVRVFKGKPYNGEGGWKDTIQYEDGKEQYWYGKYFIPSTSIFTKQGQEPRPENILKDGSIIVNFQIVGYKNGIETLSKDQMFTYVPKQWIAEGGPKDQKYHPGDVIVYDNKHDALKDDYQTYIIQ